MYVVENRPPNKKETLNLRKPASGCTCQTPAVKKSFVRRHWQQILLSDGIGEEILSQTLIIKNWSVKGSFVGGSLTPIRSCGGGLWPCATFRGGSAGRRGFFTPRQTGWDGARGRVQTRVIEHLWRVATSLCKKSLNQKQTKGP